MDEATTRKLTPEEAAARRSRNVWLALIIVGFMAVVMTVTMVRLSQGTDREAERRAAEAANSPLAPKTQETEPDQ
jgi:flagellar basal body-associated protein FliL